MRIAVCDDEEKYRQEIKTRIDRLVNSLDVIVESYSDGRELIRKFEKNPYDMVFLDIEMPDMDGITLARKLRDISEKLYIVFLTGHVEYALTGYEVNALRYLTKPVDEDKLREVIRFVSDRMKQKHQLRVREAGEDIILDIESVLYFEAQDQYICIHTDSGEHLSRYNISEYEKELIKYGFFRCHRSYIISLARVKKLVKNSVIMDDGSGVPVSRGNIQALKDALYVFVDSRSI
ncbi:two component transcriptional regulator, LytTR family [Eubacterium ruminantium]|nr:two component transcriptional regulator, LytTR family [Eubacterium ruminantium]